MADNSKPVVEVKDSKADWQYVEIPATDLFGESHSGVSINFEQYQPEIGEDGQPTGNSKRYFVSPEVAGEITRLLETRLRSDMRVLQPNQDKKMLDIMRRNGKRVPNVTS